MRSVRVFAAFAALFAFGSSLTLAQEAIKFAKSKAARKAQGPAPAPTFLDSLKIAKGFKVEPVHVVNRESEGSWVSLTVDPKGRLIASDQYGKLFRITPSKPGGSPSDTKVEAINVDIGEAQGLLWAFNALYVVVNRGEKYASGLYRVTDTNNDDQLDKVETLRLIEGGGEHGPHAVVLSPDGKSLYVVAGNATKLPEIVGSKVPKHWGEDHLLPRMVDGNGFMATEKAPGGWVCQVTPDGKEWTLISMGYRNAYDFAFSKEGDAFTFDSDMEWDMSTPWYRPTRVCEVASGSDLGYRNGAGKFPVYYFDTIPPVVDIGPGSPTGVAFGYGAKFPAKYQDAFYISDWSYGKLFAVHLKPSGAGYTADVEEFVTGTPLPLTDLTVHPDGSLYFAIGGRRTASGLYRIVYTGEESTAPSLVALAGSEARVRRRILEAFHGKLDPKAVDTAWPALSDPDRSIRFAARIALESQLYASYIDRVRTEKNPRAKLEGLLALVRSAIEDPAHRTDPINRKPDANPTAPPEFAHDIFNQLLAIDRSTLDDQGKLDHVRLFMILLNRSGRPDAGTVKEILTRFSPEYPSKTRIANSDLCALLVYLEDPTVAGKTMKMIATAPTQEEQMDLAQSLRTLKTGWTPELRKAYLTWFAGSAAGFKGGPSFGGFLKQMKADTVARLSDQEKADFKDLIDAPVMAEKPIAAALPRPFKKEWTLDELVPIVDEGLKSKRDIGKGRALFAATNCYGCHRFANEGGAVGPDLTGVAGRYTNRDLLESIVDPSKVISDQYQAVTVATTDGKIITGRIMNLHGDGIMINTDMLNPSKQVTINRVNIEELKPSKVSMMPVGLLNTLDQDEILDLVAYLKSGITGQLSVRGN